ncbi:MAG: endolytic transglycosylase MltG [Bdellovibrionaceae bacterium]|nr:endolytic transglycosylase MltG [Pseudobdellovibrionaceae bacterium]
MKNRPLWVFLIGSSILFLGITLLIVWTAWNFLSIPPGTGRDQIVYEVTPGRPFSKIAEDLQSIGVVRDARLFSLYARFVGQRGKVKVGEYGFTESMVPSDVLSILTSGKSITRPFTVVEGWNIFDIAAAWEKSGFGKSSEFLSFVRDPSVVRQILGEELPSLEGYLFPETYQITKYTGLDGLIRLMVNKFNSVWSDLESKYRIPDGWSKKKIVVLASLIEKETGAPEERRTISAVFHNRLKKGMRLQTDPTIIYGIAIESGVVPINITKADILRPTAYNTYTIYGLPPGPIANPGRAALEAALLPTDEPYLYFVSRNDGTHIFSEDYQSHQRAVEEFQKNRKAREGKSWRDRLKGNK